MKATSPLTGAPLVGKLVGKQAGPFSVMAILGEIVELGHAWVEIHEREVTKRARIQAEAEVAVAEINARRDLFLTYLDRAFDEREKNFGDLFARLDKAIANNSAAVGPILASITTLAAKSPFADLHDPSLVRQRLDDADAEWEV